MTASEPVNILMVDDQPAKLLTYEAILSELGENLIKATSARQALKILLQTDVAVVLMDVSMPEFNGFELADMIRQHPRFQKTAIIFISGVHLSEADTINGYRRGAVDYISVPVVPEVLRAKVGVFVELRRKTRQLEQLNDELERRVEERTEDLKRSESQFRTLANNIPQLAWMAHADGSAFWYSERWSDFSGMPITQLMELGWADLRHPDHADRIQSLMQRSIQLGQPWENTFPLRSASGAYRWFLWRCVPIRDSNGDVVRWFGTGTDVSSQIAAEEEIRLLNQQLEQRVTELETIMQVMPAGVAISTGKSFSGVTTNPGFRDIFDSAEILSPKDKVGSSSESPHPSPFWWMEQAIWTGQSIMDTEMQVRDKNGTKKHVIARASPLLEMSGSVRGSVGVFLDVTHRKSLEHTSRERAELLELASEAIMVRDVRGALRYWNSGAEALYGWRRHDVVDKSIHALLKTVFPVSCEEVERSLSAEGSWRGSLIQRTRTGREVVVASRMGLDRETGNILEINRDITGELRAEEALRQTEKLAAMGRVAGIIAHEINNPLEAITNAFYLLRNHPSLDMEAQRYAEMAEQELERASQITRQTLSFYRESKQPITVSLQEVIESVLELQQRNLQSSRITLQKRYCSSGVIYGYPVELRQVFLNLVGNSIQAMPEGGTLRVRVGESTERASGQQGIAISICDTGSGIQSEHLDKLFQPFFSTKSTKGTGLGLWISKGIVQKYEGSISFRSLRFRHNGNVTCFRVFLPTQTSIRSASAKPEPLKVSVASA